jgi:hypothetical protein
MTTYTVLSEDEKDQIKVAAIRNLEYQMYALEMEVVAENAKATPDAGKLANLAADIAEKETQIAAL